MELDDRSHAMWHVVGYCVREGEVPSPSMLAWKFDLWLFVKDAEVGEEVQMVIETVKTILASERYRFTTIDAIIRKAVLFRFQNGDPAFLAWNEARFAPEYGAHRPCRGHGRNPAYGHRECRTRNRLRNAQEAGSWPRHMSWS